MAINKILHETICNTVTIIKCD